MIALWLSLVHVYPGGCLYSLLHSRLVLTMCLHGIPDGYWCAPLTPSAIEWPVPPRSPRSLITCSVHGTRGSHGAQYLCLRMAKFCGRREVNSRQTCCYTFQWHCAPQNSVGACSARSSATLYREAHFLEFGSRSLARVCIHNLCTSCATVSRFHSSGHAILYLACRIRKQGSQLQSALRTCSLTHLVAQIG